MGLSIHYSGKIINKESLPQMMEEVKDIAGIYNWEYTCYENEFPAGALGSENYNLNIYGISFTPPQCETVFFTFLSNGRMSGPHLLQFFGKGSSDPRPEFLCQLSVKTQYAGIELHKVLIHFFRYISDKYLSDFEMKDEGRYWETGDERQLGQIFRRYNNLIEGISTALETFPVREGESIDAYFSRIMGYIQQRKLDE